MSGTLHDVVVTSPTHLWLGTSLEQKQPPVLAVLVGKNTKQKEVPTSESSEDVVNRLKAESDEMDIVVLFFEKDGALWRDVPVEKIGNNPFLVNGALTASYFGSVRACETNDEQQSFLKTIGLAVDDQFVGC